MIKYYKKKLIIIAKKIRTKIKKYKKIQSNKIKDKNYSY